MIGTEKIAVSLSLDGQDIDVGELVLSNRKIYFKYTSAFLDKGLNISPIRLPYSNQIVSAEYEPFDGLFGVFNDSLPDGWGRLLLDRTLSSKGINISDITPLDRLAFVGYKGMGALVYQPEIESGKITHPGPELDTIADEMNQVLKGTSPEIIEKLFILGGSSGGARPKIFAGYNDQTGELVHGLDSLPEGYTHWIIKFASSSDNPEIANIEFAYSKMALLAGIEMSECRLFAGKSGRVYFGTRRFDRIGNRRLHMHTASGIMHDNFRISTMDYGHLMDCAFRLEKHVHAHEKIFRLAAFNVYSHNRDDHSKNFSFLMNAKGEWQFAPAYDLTFSYSGYGFHSTMIAGESKNPGRKDLMKLATHFGIKNAKPIIEQVQEAISNWEEIAKESGVSKNNRQSIKNALDKLRD
ncbi:type II toxin-antitoxin system HipA family toxin [Maribellus comscasis]|uniref:Type II toxin-antitoxin system HipA family toxin n=1 Tax=Maribellus comscasis TaxID=2681766 RepID=A0A6I6JSM5_9BACT|nr:type II toxin-antitoxin system HipA family toxin [Maribellus comscasis]QGY46065.1 type II toxin-antitoxin system HipA family toxin [Maribellus comscasis]